MLWLVLRGYYLSIVVFLRNNVSTAECPFFELSTVYIFYFLHDLNLHNRPKTNHPPNPRPRSPFASECYTLLSPLFIPRDDLLHPVLADMQRNPAQPSNLRRRYQAVQEQRQRNGFTSSSTDVSLDGPGGLELSMHLPKEPYRTFDRNAFETQSDRPQAIDSNLLRRFPSRQEFHRHL